MCTVYGPILRLLIACRKGLGVELQTSCIVAARKGEAIIVMDCAIASPYVMYYYHYYFYCCYHHFWLILGSHLNVGQSNKLTN